MVVHSFAHGIVAAFGGDSLGVRELLLVHVVNLW